MGLDALGFMIMFLTMSMTIASFVFKKGFISFLAAGAWVIMAMFAISQSIGLWDIYSYLLFLSIAMIMACVFAPLAWRETAAGGEKAEESEDSETEDLRKEIEAMRREQAKYAFLHRPRNRR